MIKLKAAEELIENWAPSHESAQGTLDLFAPENLIEMLAEAQDQQIPVETLQHLLRQRLEKVTEDLIGSLPIFWERVMGSRDRS